MTIPSDHNQLEHHGDADEYPPGWPPHDDLDAPVDERRAYYADQNHEDSRRIFCWVLVAAIILGIVFALSQAFK